MNLDSSTLTFTLALAAGVVAQAFAQRMRIPGIVLLLIAGVLLGPEVLNLVRPATLGPSLSHIVSLSVAIILFGGGLALNVDRLRGEARVIRRLILSGALVTAIGGALAAHYVLGWPWSIAVVFGALIIVTGPTVILPLLRRIRVNANVSTILEAEAVLIDPIGAIVSVVTLEIVLAESTGGAARGLVGLPSRLILGIGIGVIGGVLISQLLRNSKWIPDGHANILTLALVLLLHEASDAIKAESGILAVTVAGLVVGNVKTRIARELREFKEQLTVMLVGALFIMLAADVSMQSVLHLGWNGLTMVLLLMLVIRPLDILVSTRGSTLTMRERAFLAWLSPRGIVAAAVASVFARRLEESGQPVGEEFAAMVFLVIAATVLIQGLSGGWVANKLGIRRRSDSGFIIVGANTIGVWLARALRQWQEDVILIDTNPTDAAIAANDGTNVLHGNAHDEAVLERADAEGRRVFIAVTPNEGANLLLAHNVRTHYHTKAFAALRAGKASIAPDNVEEAGAGVLFGKPVDLESWIHRARAEGTQLTHYTSEAAEPVEVSTVVQRIADRDKVSVLPLIYRHRDTSNPVSLATTLQTGDELILLTVPHDAG
jgi:NhaP-type Na+/H+ or K+/H+ antiporter